MLCQRLSRAKVSRLDREEGEARRGRDVVKSTGRRTGREKGKDLDRCKEREASNIYRRQ